MIMRAAATRFGPTASARGQHVAVEVGAARLPLTVATVAAHDTPAERAAADAVVAAAAAVAAAAGATVDVRVAVGRAADTIAALAADAGADLVVVGRGGPQAHGRLHFGSNAQRIVGLVPGAVLVVRT